MVTSVRTYEISLQEIKREANDFCCSYIIIYIHAGCQSGATAEPGCSYAFVSRTIAVGI